ncbi:hypothetical protein DM02DRAFT_617615 [Periconia macrospinosa]|uniref:Uncharacterized protein n=1 Tax=Periconia macrospinosa TaxID=97972 RepID=A0A2V1DF78_9PLEO|nr:hypothetical protein DM02DRAFT_617615 [Periconia macrospinosa]
MESHNYIRQEPYQDSPTPSRSSTPDSNPTSSTKLLSGTSHNIPVQQLEQHTFEPYRDEPPNDSSEPLLPSPPPRRQHPCRPKISIPHTTLSSPYPPPQAISPYTDSSIPNHDHPNNENVPLDNLDLYPYPAEAPPSYNVVVRESFRATLIPHVPPAANNFSSQSETDEEAALVTEEWASADDVRFRVENVVTALVVSIALLSVAAWFTLASLRDGVL